MAGQQYNFRILMDTVSGSKYSYGTSPIFNPVGTGIVFIDTNSSVTMSTQEASSKINSMLSCSYQNAYHWTDDGTSTHAYLANNFGNPVTGHKFMSCSIEGGKATGSLKFEEVVHSSDRLKRFKFFGTKVCSVFGLPEDIWIYTDDFVLSATESIQNQFSGDLIAERAFVRNSLNVSNVGSVSSDLPFRVVAGSGSNVVDDSGRTDRWIKFINVSGSSYGENNLMMGYSSNNGVYEIKMNNNNVLHPQSLNVTASNFTFSGSRNIIEGIGSGASLKIGDGTTMPTNPSGSTLLVDGGATFKDGICHGSGFRADHSIYCRTGLTSYVYLHGNGTDTHNITWAKNGDIVGDTGFSNNIINFDEIGGASTEGKFSFTSTGVDVFDGASQIAAFSSTGTNAWESAGYLELSGSQNMNGPGVGFSGGIGCNGKKMFDMRPYPYRGAGAWNPVATIAMAYGNHQRTDADFAHGTNGISGYDNNTSGTVVRSRVFYTGSSDLNDSDGRPVPPPNTSGYVIKVAHTNAISAHPGYGGVVSSFDTQANHTYMQVFQALIPEGYRIERNANLTGNHSIRYFLTSQLGTGQWEWYAMINECGKNGSFGTAGHLYILDKDGGEDASHDTFNWYIASMQNIDLTKFDGPFFGTDQTANNLAVRRAYPYLNGNVRAHPQKTQMVADGANSGSLRNGIFPACSVFMSANHNVVDNTLTTIPFNSVSYDIADDWDTSSYNFVAPVDGLYAFKLQATFDGLDSTDTTLRLYMEHSNGTSYNRSWDNNGTSEEDDMEPHSFTMTKNFIMYAGNTITFRYHLDEGTSTVAAHILASESSRRVTFCDVHLITALHL